MKKHVKVLLCLSAGLVSLGLVLSTIGLATGAQLSPILQNGLWNISVSTAQREHPVSPDGLYTVSREGIHGLAIDWLDGEITVVPYAGSEIVIQETSPMGLSERNSLRYTVKNGLLSISGAPGQVFFGGFSDQLFSDKTLTVQLPADLALETMDLAVADADIFLQGLQLQELNLDCLDGDLSLVDSTMDALSLNCADGDLALANCQTQSLEINSLDGDVAAANCAIAQLKLSTAGGDFTGSLTRCPEQVEVDSMDGSVALTLPAESQFTASFTSLDGDYTSSFPGVFQGGIHTVGNGSAQITMSTMNGDLSIEPQVQPFYG